jgi:hypothetical protein
LRDKLGIKEPIVEDVRHNNDRLWQMFLTHMGEIQAKNISDGGRQ